MEGGRRRKEGRGGAEREGRQPLEEAAMPDFPFLLCCLSSGMAGSHHRLAPPSTEVSPFLGQQRFKKLWQAAENLHVLLNGRHLI